MNKIKTYIFQLHLPRVHAVVGLELGIQISIFLFFFPTTTQAAELNQKSKNLHFPDPPTADSWPCISTTPGGGGAYMALYLGAGEVVGDSSETGDTGTSRYLSLGLCRRTGTVGSRTGGKNSCEGGRLRPRRAQQNIKKPMATRNRVPPIDAPAMTAAVGTLLLMSALGVADEGVAAPVESAGAIVNTRVLDTITSVDEKTPDEISMDETTVLYSTTVETTDVTMLVGSGVDAGTVGVGVVGVGVVGVGAAVGDGGAAVGFDVTVTTTVTGN